MPEVLYLPKYDGLLRHGVQTNVATVSRESAAKAAAANTEHLCAEQRWMIRAAAAAVSRQTSKVRDPLLGRNKKK